MQKVTKYQTLDGVLHDSEQAARSHADKKYGELLCSLSRATVDVQKYVDMLDFIEKNLPLFLKLQTLKDDMKLQEYEDEYDDTF